MGIKFTNFSVSTIANAGGIAAGDLSLDVAAGDGALFPSLGAGDYFYATLVDSSANREIVKVTARSTDTFTIVRAQDNTSARAFSLGDKVELRLNAAALEEFMAGITATADEINTACDGITATAAEINTACDGITAVASELNQLDGVTVGGNTSGDILTTDDTQNFSGKTSTDGFRITGGDLTVGPASGTLSKIYGAGTTDTALGLYGGGYSTTTDSGAVIISGKDDATVPGRVRIHGTNGSTSALAIDVKQDGTVNFPVGLEIGGSAITETAADINSAAIYVDNLSAATSEVNNAADGIGVTIPRQKIVSIGDWNMDSTGSINVAHGLTYSDIIGILILIRDDLDSLRRPLLGTDGTWAYASGANINLGRDNGTYFDSTDFDSTSYNRGWIIIGYKD